MLKIMEKGVFLSKLRLLQNFSFVRVSNKKRSFTGLLPEKLLSRGKTNRVVEQVHYLIQYSPITLVNIFSFVINLSYI